MAKLMKHLTLNIRPSTSNLRPLLGHIAGQIIAIAVFHNLAEFD
jgi:hypothetical protein